MDLPEYQLLEKRPVTPEMHQEIGEAISDHGISLFNGDRHVGSATLVSVGKVKGFLTAHHVWEEMIRMAKSKEGDPNSIVMVLGSFFHRFEWPFNACDSVVVGPYSSSTAQTGPDLAFIELKSDTLELLDKLSSLEAKKAFFRLDGSKFEIYQKLPERQPWLVFGAPAENTRTELSESGEPFTRVNHFLAFAQLLGIEERGEFDYAKVEVESGVENYPKNYFGMSGSGAWVSYRRATSLGGSSSNETPSLVLLVGVAFYQVPERDNFMSLRLHGPKSIYEAVVRAIAKKGSISL